MTQIYVALITYLLLAYLKFLTKLNLTLTALVNLTLTALVRILQLNLFQKLTFEELFKLKPDKQNIQCNIKQLTLAFF